MTLLIWFEGVIVIRVPGWASAPATSARAVNLVVRERPKRPSMLKNIAIAALSLAFAPLAIPANAQVARVIDGDTIDIAGERIRLHGIDAPESAQTCVADGATWPCGHRAATALVDLIAGSPVSCRARGKDKYGRTIAACTVRGESIEAWMVMNGWALAYRRYSRDYIAEETVARSARAGIWRGKFIKPWEWRQGKRLPPVQAATVSDSAGGCVIKGNISSSGEKIYHVPGGQYYDRTKINTAKGERLFCTGADAIAAGWRKSKR